MKVKEYLASQKNKQLEGLKVRTPKAVVGYIVSLGACIVFLNNVKGSTDKGRLYPQIVEKDSDVQGWEIVGEDIKCNCDMLTSHKYTFNV